MFTRIGWPGTTKVRWMNWTLKNTHPHPVRTQPALKKKKDLLKYSQVLVFTGGAKGDRTPDLMTASHALSHLSYSPSKLVFHNRKCLLVSI